MKLLKMVLNLNFLKNIKFILLGFFKFITKNREQKVIDLESKHLIANIYFVILKANIYFL